MKVIGHCPVDPCVKVTGGVEDEATADGGRLGDVENAVRSAELWVMVVDIKDDNVDLYSKIIRSQLTQLISATDFITYKKTGLGKVQIFYPTSLRHKLVYEFGCGYF